MRETLLKLFTVMIIGISFVVGCSIVAKSISNSNSGEQPIQVKEEKALMTEDEAAEYLNIDISDFKKLVSHSEIQRKQQHSYNTYEYVPVLIVEGKHYFSKDELDKWIEYNMLNHREIEFF